MRLAVAVLVLASALTAHAQTPPDSPPAAPPQAAPAAQDQPSGSEASPAVVTPEQAERPAPRPAPAVRAPVARPQAQPPAPAAAEPPHPAAEYGQQLRELRAQVSRLQSELDAERAALLQAEESGAAPSARGAWESLAAAVVIALAAGFVLGWRVLDRRIRRKYGGLRIY